MLNVEALNALDRQEFAGLLAGLFEHSPWVPARTADERPFVNREELFASLCQTVRKASDDEKISLIRAHPDLVGTQLLTTESQSEQATAGLDRLTPEEIRRFREYNSRYRERFGFPFVICARLNQKEAILEAFPRRLQNQREQEIETALEEIFKIGRLRLQSLVE
jgi:2-oxo-4-hydroxy-4-carboxy-5-ureidoimidazoline decarboxylase